MPVFRKDKMLILYAHVPKSGGTTVNQRLRELGYDLAFFDGDFWNTKKSRWYKSSPQHITNSDRLLLLPDSLFDYTFSVVRDPVSRFLSAYNHNRGRIGYSVSFSRFLNRMETRVQRRGDYFSYKFDNHFLPASRMIPPNSNVFRLEDGIAHLFSQLKNDIGLNIPLDDGVENRRSYQIAESRTKIRTIVKQTISSHSPKKAELAPNEIDRVRALYREDLENFYPDQI